MKRIRTGIVASLGAAALVWAATAGAAATDAEKCAAKKHKEIGKYVSCVQKAETKAILKGGSADTSKCEQKFHEKWGKLDSQYQTECLTMEDGESLQTAGLAFTDSLVALLGGAPACLGNGVEVGGHCWFLGPEGMNCDDLCSGEGLIYSDATRFFAGSEPASDQACGDVLNALRVPSGPIAVHASMAVGCVYCPTCPEVGGRPNYRHRDSKQTTSAAFDPIVRRACACEQP